MLLINYQRRVRESLPAIRKQQPLFGAGRDIDHQILSITNAKLLDVPFNLKYESAHCQTYLPTHLPYVLITQVLKLQIEPKHTVKFNTKCATIYCRGHDERPFAFYSVFCSSLQ